MIISVNWLKKFVPDLPEIDELSSLIGSRLVEIESVENLGEKYKDVVVAKVISAEKVEGSDHLNLCKIDDGGVRSGIERDENGLIQVVCGAPNVRSGIFVAWLPPESIVPETFNTGDEFKLGARKLMGNMSNGMIASLRELGLGEEHDGILEISTEVFGEKLKAGVSFAELFELDDYLLEVENKSLTHRPDCFGIIGFAREVAGILGKKFELNSSFLSEKSDFLSERNVQIFTEIKNPEICEKYSAVVIDVDKISNGSNFTVEKTYLLRSGMRPIDEITDIANLLMLETGQPLHTFDFDKLVEISGSDEVKMTVRNAFAGEKLQLLDGKEIEMSESDIVVATGDSGEFAVALAGAMGGKSTAICKNTKRILVESATFNLYNLRNTQMRHGIFSEAITRFTKGQPAAISMPILTDFCEKISALGGKVISDFAASQKGEIQKNKINITREKINSVLGFEYSLENIIKTFENVGFSVFANGEKLEVEAPLWRTDIHIEEDLIEEIGRLNGYDNINLKLPLRDFRAVESPKIEQLKAEIRKILVSAGANEVLTYSFINGDLIEKIGQNPENSYKIVNSISPDLQFYRQNITGSLLSRVYSNIRSGFDEFAIFEMNTITHKKLGLNAEDVPNEAKELSFVYSNKRKTGVEAFYQVKKIAEYLFEKLGFSVSKIEENAGEEFQDGRSAVLFANFDGEEKAFCRLGEFNTKVRKGMKLPEATAGFSLSLEEILPLWEKKEFNFEKISKFQSVERDLTLRVEYGKKYSEILGYFAEVLRNCGENKIEIKPLDIYNTEDGSKNISLRFKITPFEKTLNGDEIREIVEKIENEARKNGAEII